MDYQAGTSSSKIIFAPHIIQRIYSFACVVVLTVCIPSSTLFAQTTENPLQQTVTIMSTVLVNPGVHPDTPPTPSPGPISTENLFDSAIFKGLAYPESKILLLKNGIVLAQIPANSDGTFDLRVRNLAAGTYSFGLRADDKNNVQSKLLQFTVVISSGVITTVDGIFLPPTITSDKLEVKKGNPIMFSGYSTPNADIRISFLPTFSRVELLKKSKANASGTWMYSMDSSELGFGNYEVKVRSILPNDLSPYSDPFLFKVGSTDVLRSKNALLGGFRKKCDLNDDNRVNLLDFSIMAFWYKRLGFPAKVDLNTDASVNLTDLSILAYCWTG